MKIIIYLVLSISLASATVKNIAKDKLLVLETIQTDYSDLTLQFFTSDSYIDSLNEAKVNFPENHYLKMKNVNILGEPYKLSTGAIVARPLVIDIQLSSCEKDGIAPGSCEGHGSIEGYIEYTLQGLEFGATYLPKKK